MPLFRNLRWKFSLLVFLTLFLVAGMFWLRLDSWLTHEIESEISSITATQVDVINLKLSWNSSQVHIDQLQIGDGSSLPKNFVELNDIGFTFDLPALLERRLVIRNFSLGGIEWSTSRTTSSQLPYGKKKTSRHSWFSQVGLKAFEKLTLKEHDVPKVRLLDFRIPDDPREALDGVLLKSEAQFKDLVTEGEEIVRKLTEHLEEVSDSEDYERKFSDLKLLVLNPSLNVNERLLRIREPIEFFETEKRRLETLHTHSDLELTKLKKARALAQVSLESDVVSARDSVSLQTLHPENFSKLLFGLPWLEKGGRALYQQDLLRSFFVGRRLSNAIEVRESQAGSDIVFLNSHKKPNLIISDATLNLKGAERSIVNQLYQIDFKNFNSDPLLFGKPSELNFHADLKKTLASDVFLKAAWDYTGTSLKDALEFKVQGIDARIWPAGIEETFPFKLTSGIAEAVSHLNVIDNQYDWKTKIEFKGVEFDFSEAPKQGIVLPVLEAALNRTPNFYLEFHLQILNDQIHYEVTSDLDGVFVAEMQKTLGAKWKDFESRLSRDIRNRVLPISNQADKMIDHLQSMIDTRLHPQLESLLSISAQSRELELTLKKALAEASEDSRH